MAVNVFQDDPSWAVAEFLTLLLHSRAHLISVDPTILSSRVQDQEAADTLESIAFYGTQIGPPELRDPRFITYLAEELEADPDARFGRDQNGMVPQLDRFTDEEAREFVDAEDEEDLAGWYARMTMPGYMDSTDWMGPYRREAEAYTALEEQEGPLEPPDTIIAVIDFLRNVWNTIYRIWPAGFRNAPGSGQRLRVMMFDFAIDSGFDEVFSEELLNSLPESHYWNVMAPNPGRS